MPKNIRTIFIGTPDFGIPSLRILIEDELFDVVAVITQPDKKKGRKQVLSPPPIKTEAEKHNIVVWQPEQISNYKFPISNIDLIVVAAYAQILPKHILDLPKYGCINVHGSLLPYCRGASCVQQPIIEGAEETGVTIMLMDEGLDTGPILAQNSITIENTDTTGTLFDKLSNLGGELLIPTLKDLVSGNITPKPQNENQKTCVRTLKKEDGRINWEKPAEEIERFIRAMHPWPGAFCAVNRRQTTDDSIIIKILTVEHELFVSNEHAMGKLFIHNKKLAVQCGKDALVIKKIQPEGKKPMSGEEFINGYGHLVRSVLE